MLLRVEVELRTLPPSSHTTVKLASKQLILTLSKRRDSIAFVRCLPNQHCFVVMSHDLDLVT